MVRIRFIVWLVSGYAHVFALLSVVIAPCPMPTQLNTLQTWVLNRLPYGQLWSQKLFSLQSQWSIIWWYYREVFFCNITEPSKLFLRTRTCTDSSAIELVISNASTEQLQRSDVRRKRLATSTTHLDSSTSHKTGTSNKQWFNEKPRNQIKFHKTDCYSAYKSQRSIDLNKPDGKQA